MGIGRRAALAGAVALASLSATLAGCGGTPSTPQATLAAFVADWGHQDWAAMGRLVDHPPADFTAVNAGAFADLAVTAAVYTTGRVQRKGGTATAPVTGHLTLNGVGPWSPTTVVHLRNRSGRWLVEWATTTIDPALAPGDHFAINRIWAPRAPILGAGGALLVSSASRVQVGVVGRRITDPAKVSSLLVAAGATAAEASSALAEAKAHPGYFVPVFEVSQAAYTSTIKGSPLYSVAGTQFEPVTKLQAVTPGLAAHLVGAVAPVTAQELKTLGPAYSAGDTVGQSGLEGYYETRLAGTPGGTVTVVSAQGATVATLATAPPKAGQPVQTGIDPAYQRAGEAALAGVTKPAALVAVRASTGEILASVSQDPAGQDLDYALDATVAPGSTFKTITSTALLTKGLTPASSATCPTTITVDGETFHNFEGEAAAQLSFAAAFARSCNTAFIGLATAHLQASDFPHFAALYGIGTTPQMGYPAFGGKVPLPADEADLASTAIGQGRVVVSPLDMATVAAGIDAGTARAPRLVTGAPDDTAAPKVLDPTVVTALHQMMAQVVTSGTAAGYGLPAGTYAKTGTAEFGTTKPPQTHAWMIGFDGDVAFAVFVYGGGVGGPVAGPLAAKFLDALGPAA